MSEMSLNQALDEVRQGNITLNRIRELANSLSVNLEANVTSIVLYSGEFLKGTRDHSEIRSHDAVISLARQSSSIGIIDNTEVGKF